MSSKNEVEILLVEDNPDDLELALHALRQEKLANRVEVARDGEEAISNISLAAWRMFDRLARASEYGRVISPGNSSR